MIKTFARLHAMSNGCKCPDFVDLFYVDNDGRENLVQTVHIDVLSDLNLSDDACHRISAGHRVAIKIVEDTED